MTGLKDTGRIEIPPLPPGVVTLPDGAYKVADGTLHLPEGAAVPEGAFEIPKGSVKLPDGAELPAGAVDLGDGIVHLPEGTTPPAGSLPIQAGSLKLPEGTTALPEGTARGFSEEGNAVLLDREGNILSEDGTLLQHHSNAKRENPRKPKTQHPPKRTLPSPAPPHTNRPWSAQAPAEATTRCGWARTWAAQVTYALNQQPPTIHRTTQSATIQGPATNKCERMRMPRTLVHRKARTATRQTHQRVTHTKIITLRREKIIVAPAKESGPLQLGQGQSRSRWNLYHPGSLSL